MTIPGGISIDAFSLCYGLGNDPLNQAPVLDPIGNQSVTAGQTLNITAFDDPDYITAFDTDDLPSGGAVTISITEDPLNPLPVDAEFEFVDNVNGTYTYSFSWLTTDADVGSYTVTFTASDGDLEDSETITIFVNSATPSCEALGTYDNTLEGTLDDTGVVCPDTGRVLVCNIELDEPFYGLVASDSCCVCNNNSPLQECDADIPAGTTNADGVPSCTLTPAEKDALGDLLRPAEVTTHIELNNDPYYCTTIGGRRTCYRY
jgi:PKD repeat protein